MTKIVEEEEKHKSLSSVEESNSGNEQVADSSDENVEKEVNFKEIEIETKAEE